MLALPFLVAALPSLAPQTGTPPFQKHQPAPGVLKLPVQPGWPVTYTGLGGGAPSALAVEDLNDDGQLEVVMRTRDSLAVVHDISGQVLPGWPVDLSSPTGVLYIGYSFDPVVGDIDGDGDAEVFFGYHGFHHDGSLVSGWPKPIQGCFGRGPQVVSIADLDGDGSQEVLGIYSRGVINGADPCLIGSKLFVWDGTGEPMPGFPVSLPQVMTNRAADLRGLAVGDLDGDGDLEIILSGLTASLSGSFLDVFVYDHLGVRVDGFPRRLRTALGPFNTIETPVLADLDGDGSDEILVSLGLQTAGVELHVLEETGDARPGWPLVLQDPVLDVMAVTVGNIDGLPGLEITTTRELTGPEIELSVWDAGGNQLPGWPLRFPGWNQRSHWNGGFASAAGWSEPILVDLVGDARLEMLHLLHSASGDYHQGFLIGLDSLQQPQVTPLLRLFDSYHAGSFLVKDLDGDGDVELGTAHSNENAVGVTPTTFINFWDAPWRDSPVPGWPQWMQNSGRTNRLP